MKKLKLFFLMFGLSCGINALAQTELGAKVEVSQPKYITDKVYQEDIKRIEQWQGLNGSDGYWIVFSDRSNNKTYNEPRSGSPVYTTLDFNQVLRVAKVSNGYALVYKDGQDVQYPAISKKAETLGWVPLKNLLLWTRCPMNSFGIYDKALIAVNIDEVRNPGEFDIKKKNMVTSDPDTDDAPTKHVSTQRIYFVLKEQVCDDGKKRLLLANVSRLEGLDAQNLVGWIDETNISRWTQRSCLEREWIARELEQYLDGEVIKVYDNYDHMGNSSPIWKWTLSKDDTRADGNMLRFPILDDKEHQDLYKMTLYGSHGDPKAARRDQEFAERKMNEALSDLRKVNIILVIDGTESMKNYYQPVKVAIKNAIDKHLSEFDEVKVGAVIYRDSINGKFMTEICPMKDPSDPRLNEFLDKGGEYGITRTPNDHTMEEDMYTGIFTALDWKKMGYNKDEANVMILVGDCGNEPEDQDKWHDRLVEKLKDCNMQLIAFQVNSGSVGAYKYFRRQVQRLINDNIESQYKAVAEKIQGRNPQLGKFKEYSDQSGRFYEFPQIDGDGGRFFFGAVRYPREDGPADPAEIGQLIVDNIEKNAAASREQFESFQRVFYNSEGEETTYGQFDEQFVINRVGKQVFDDFKKNNTTIAVTGYSKRLNRDGRSLWRPVVFISEGELASMMGDLKKVYVASTSKNRDRSQYVDALTSVVKAMIPEAQKTSEAGSDENVKKTTLGEITAMIGGLNVQTDATGSEYSLVDLMDPKVVSDEDFNNILYEFSKKYEKLENLQKKKECVKKFGSEIYFWVPVKDLP